MILIIDDKKVPRNTEDNLTRVEYLDIDVDDKKVPRNAKEEQHNEHKPQEDHSQRILVTEP